MKFLRYLLLFNFLLSTPRLLAGGSDQYVKVTVESTPTGAGKVYATVSSPSSSPVYNADTYSTDPTALDPGSTSVANSIAYLYSQKANASSNYIFEKWTTSGWSSYQSNTSVPITGSGDNTSSDNPKSWTFTASFKEAGAVRAVSNDETKGVVSNNNITNSVGQSVTLTAIENIYKGKFKHWIGPSGNVIEDKSFTIPVTESNKGTYTAYFEERDLSNGMYIMLYNEQTSKYLGLLGDNDDLGMTQRYFRNSILLADGTYAHSSPAFVLKISGTADDFFNLHNIDFAAQGTSIKANPSASAGQLDFFRVKDGSYHIRGTFYGNIGFMCYSTTSGSSYGTPTTIEEHYGTVYHPGAYNGATLTSTAHFWKIAILTEDEHTHCFGAEPKSAVTFKDKYYSTMYTSFPYKCLDGVNAFIVDKINNDGTIHLKKISSGIVPAETPVILQCNSTEAKNNRLLPIMENVSSITETNNLKGEIWIKDYSKSENNYRTKFEASTMRVLNNNQCAFKNINNDDILASTGETGTLTYIQNNTCYLNLAKVSTSNRKDEYTFEVPGNPVITPESQTNTSGVSVPVTISCPTQGASIKYSIDEGETWLDYTSGTPINILDDTKIMAKAVDPDNDFESEIVTATYSFTPKEVTLDELPTTADQITYKVTTPLTVVYKDDANNTIYAKDNNGAPRQQAEEGMIDFMAEHMPAGTYTLPDDSRFTVSYSDHSNWIAIKFHNIPVDIDEGIKIKNVTGKVTDVTNRTIECSSVEADGRGRYSLNTYSISNFFGTQVCQANGLTYFFMIPQPNEICQIVWALWNDGVGPGYFEVPQKTSDGFQIGLDGYTDADLGLYKGGAPFLETNHVYKFNALVQKGTTASTNKAITKSDYIVYPLYGLGEMGSLVDPTIINSITGAKEVKGVRYYNAMGVESNVPFKGVNIVVTTYSDGTRTTTKILK